MKRQEIQNEGREKKDVQEQGILDSSELPTAEKSSGVQDTGGPLDVSHHMNGTYTVPWLEPTPRVHVQ